MTTTDPSPPRKRSLIKAAGTTILVLALTGSLGAAAYWQEELRGMVELQAWNRGAPTHLVGRLIDVCHSGSPEDLEELLAPEHFGIEKDDAGRVEKVLWRDHGGQRSVDPGSLVPAGTPQQMSPVIRNRGGTPFYSVVVQFEDGKWGVFGVKRANSKLVVFQVPTVFDDQRPTDLTMY